MLYPPNTKTWEKGDLVIHWCDAKKPYMLMMVTGYTRDGLVKTKYAHPDKPKSSLSNKVLTNPLKSLLDPADFAIDTTGFTPTVRLK